MFSSSREQSVCAMRPRPGEGTRKHGRTHASLSHSWAWLEKLSLDMEACDGLQCKRDAFSLCCCNRDAVA